MKSNPELIQWLRENSSGSYRPSADAADRLESALHVLRQITQDLPQKRDWLNPDLEREAKALIDLDRVPDGTQTHTEAPPLPSESPKSPFHDVTISPEQAAEGMKHWGHTGKGKTQPPS